MFSELSDCNNKLIFKSDWKSNVISKIISSIHILYAKRKLNKLVGPQYV